jgi:hypothetical protein
VKVRSAVVAGALVAVAITVVVVRGRRPARPPEGEVEPARSRAPKAPVPRFVTQSRAPVRRNPTLADYDGSALLRSRAKPALQAFLDEPRDPEWAPVREARISEVRRQDLARYPGAQLLSVECRRAICKTLLEVPAESYPEFLRSRVRVGNTSQRVENVASPERPGYRRVVDISAVNPEYRDHQAFERLLAGGRPGE